MYVCKIVCNRSVLYKNLKFNTIIHKICNSIPKTYIKKCKCFIFNFFFLTLFVQSNPTIAKPELLTNTNICKCCSQKN